MVDDVQSYTKQENSDKSPKLRDIILHLPLPTTMGPTLVISAQLLCSPWEQLRGWQWEGFLVRKLCLSRVTCICVSCLLTKCSYRRHVPSSVFPPSWRYPPAGFPPESSVTVVGIHVSMCHQTEWPSQFSSFSLARSSGSKFFCCLIFVKSTY